MDPRIIAHKAANAAFRDSNASQQPRIKEGRPRDAPVRAASYHDRAGPANVQSTSRPSNFQRPEFGNEHVTDDMIHEAVVRYPKGIDDRQAIPNTQQKSRPPPVPPRRKTDKTGDRPQAMLQAEEDETDESVADENAFNPTDLFYLVMGVTGAGKSTFVSLLSEDAAEVGHELQSSKSVLLALLSAAD
jgi:hypothetical protein